MNDKQFKIAKISRYSWTNMHGHSYVNCRKCGGPLTKEEYASAVEDDKVIALRLPERCGSCILTSSKKKEKK